MAVLRSANFEINSTVECNGIVGAPSVVTSPVYKGTYAGATIWSGAEQGLRQVTLNHAAVYHRRAFRVNVTANPTVLYVSRLITSLDTGGGTIAYCTLIIATNGALTLEIFNGKNGYPQIGSAIPINNNQWYVVELKTVVSATVGIIELRLDGVVRATVSNTTTGTVNVGYLENAIEPALNGLTGAVYWDADLVRDDVYPGGLTVGDIWAPGIVGHGTASFTATSGTALTPALPPNVSNGDVHVMICHVSDSARGFNTPSGWDLLPASPTTIDDDNTAAQHVTCFIRRALAADGAPTVNMDTNVSTVVRGAMIIGVRGVAGISNTDGVDRCDRTINAAAATITFPSVTTTQEHDLVLALGAYEDDPSVRSLPTGWNTLTGAVQVSSLGNDMSLNHFWRVFSTGATGGFTTTVSGGTFANSVNVGAIIALKGIAVPPLGPTDADSLAMMPSRQLIMWP